MQNMLLITINFVVFGMLFHCNLRYGTLFIVEGREDDGKESSLQVRYST